MKGLSWVASILSCMGVLTMAVDVPDFFPEVKGDLTKVTWAHAVNSQKLLQEALDKGVMMLEADVSLGKLLQDGKPVGNDIPIMAHPPTNTSDLSLEQFVDRVLKENKTGIKLDFKSKEVFTKAVTMLADKNDKMKFPVWLNADILPGPVNSTTTPVDANTFLQESRNRFPNRTLSIGWTTQFGGNITEGSYGQEHIKAMKEALEHNTISQPITFPVRAVFAVKSSEILLGLVNYVPNSTLTVWGGATDPVDETLLKNLISNIGKQRTYVDIPKLAEYKAAPGKGSSGKVKGVPFLIAAGLAALGLALIARINHV